MSRVKVKLFIGYELRKICNDKITGDSFIKFIRLIRFVFRHCFSFFATRDCFFLGTGRSEIILQIRISRESDPIIMMRCWDDVRTNERICHVQCTDLFFVHLSRYAFMYVESRWYHRHYAHKKHIIYRRHIPCDIRNEYI